MKRRDLLLLLGAGLAFPPLVAHGQQKAMKAMIASPYGFWVSPITSDLVVQDTIRLDQVALDGSAIYWSESQPQKQGRYFVYRTGGGDDVEPVTPDDSNAFNVRTRVHEYGGGAFLVHEGVVYFSNFADQRLYRQDQGHVPRPITPLPPGAAHSEDPRVALDAGNRAGKGRGAVTANAPSAVPASIGTIRYADGIIDPQRGRIICVQEDHSQPDRVVNALVSVDIAGARPPIVLVAGNDFYAAPRLSPNGNRLVWLTWNHPNMPWVTTEAWVGDVQADGGVGNVRLIAGGPDEALFQPQWSPDGDLYFISDRGSGWWNLYREQHGQIEPVLPMDAEFGAPQWNFGMSTYAFE